MLAIYDDFVFELKTAPFQKMQRSTSWAWAQNRRIGERAVQQFVAPGNDEITLSGNLYPEITGGPVNLDRLRLLADQGHAHALIVGDNPGQVIGLWVIASLAETRTHHDQNGQAKKIQFNLKLKRADATQIDSLPGLPEITGGLLP